MHGNDICYCVYRYDDIYATLERVHYYLIHTYTYIAMHGIGNTHKSIYNLSMYIATYTLVLSLYACSVYLYMRVIITIVYDSM